MNNATGHLFSLDFPRQIEERGQFSFRLLSPDLVGSVDYFLRIDTYPQQIPMHSLRHFGYWDIPLSLIGSADTVIGVDGCELLLPSVAGNAPLRMPFSWRGQLKENGNAIWNFSLWQNSDAPGGEPAMRDFQAVTFLWSKPLLDNEDRTGDHIHMIPVVKPCYVAAMDITSGCNIRCKFCYNHSVREDEYGKTVKFMSPAVAEKAFQFIERCVFGGVNFGCLWEPSLHNDLAGILSLVPESVGKATTFTTNLYKPFSDAEIHALVNSNIARLNVSIQSLDPDLCDEISGRKNTLANILRNLDRIKAASGSSPIQLYFTTMMLRDTFDGLFSLAQFIHKRYSPVSHEFRTFIDPWDKLTHRQAGNYARYLLEQLLDAGDIDALGERLSEAGIPATTVANLVRGDLSKAVEEYWNRTPIPPTPENAPEEPRPSQTMANAPAEELEKAPEACAVPDEGPAVIESLRADLRDNPAVFINWQGEVALGGHLFSLDQPTPGDMERCLLAAFKRDFGYSAEKPFSKDGAPGTADRPVVNRTLYVRAVADDYLEIAGLFFINGLHADDVTEAAVELVDTDGNAVGCYELGLEDRDFPDDFAGTPGEGGWGSGYRARIPLAALRDIGAFGLAVRLSVRNACLRSRVKDRYVLAR